MKLDKQRWDVMNGILDELLELPESQRLDKLRDYCAVDSTLFNDIAALLQECAADDSLLDQNVLNLAHTLLEQLAPGAISSAGQNALQNQRIGAYILNHEIGRGGMGVVYQAERSQGDFAQRVAIKLLLNVTLAVSERFRREQQALAALNHPNITQLLDAGVTEHGLPYLIMEYIEGVPITDYCAQGNLSLAQRLQLLDQVAQALAFSHKNLIVHRDIKPSNILVTHEGQVKLLDFSIAKLLDTQWALEETATHLHLLTPSYSAPEQVLNQPITVATDIYQLGLLYYRVLTGRSPLTADISSLHELVKIVCNSEVTRPSTALLTAERLEESLPNPQEVGKLLSGDLDAIILKMLRKEPAARYPSIEAVRADIYAYQHNLPVAAHNAALSYRTGKYLKRNWRTIAVVGLATISLAVYAASMKMQNTRVQAALAKAQVEQQKAQQVAQFLSQTFEAADPNKGGLKGITAYDLLENARTKINEDLKDLPDVQAPLLNIFSKIYFRQQDYSKAEVLLTNLLNNPKAAQQLDQRLLAETQVRLAQQKIGLGQFSEAEVLLIDSLNLQKKYLNSRGEGDKDPLLGEAMIFLANALYAQERRPEAEKTISDAIEYLKALGEVGDRMRSFGLNVLANDQFLFGSLNDAIRNMKEALDLKVRVLGQFHTETSNTQLVLARMLIDKEDFDEAQVLANVAAENIKNYLPSGHPYQLTRISVLAKLAQKKGEYDLALNLVRQQQMLSNANSKLFSDLLSIDILIEQGRVVEAKKILDQTIGKDVANAYDKGVLARINSLEGRIHLSHGSASAALVFFGNALAFLNQDQIEAAIVNRDFAVAKYCDGKAAEAKKILRQALRALEKRYVDSHSQMKLGCYLHSRFGMSNQKNTVRHPCPMPEPAKVPLYFKCLNKPVASP